MRARGASFVKVTPRPPTTTRWLPADGCGELSPNQAPSVSARFRLALKIRCERSYFFFQRSMLNVSHIHRFSPALNSTLHGLNMNLSTVELWAMSRPFLCHRAQEQLHRRDRYFLSECLAPVRPMSGLLRYLSGRL